VPARAVQLHVSPDKDCKNKRKNTILLVDNFLFAIFSRFFSNVQFPVNREENMVAAQTLFSALMIKKLASITYAWRAIMN